MVIVHGTGSIGTRHLRVLDRMGVPSRGLSVRSGDALGRDARAVIVATSTGRHIADATAAVRAGCHVLVEKPLASSAVGLAALDRIAREMRRQIFVACCLRFDAALVAFRAKLPSIGRVRDVRVECRSYLPEWRPGDYRTHYSARRDEGGVLRDLIHEIDYASWLFGWPAKLVGRAGNTGTLEIESEDWAELEWTARARVSMRLDYVTKPTRRVMRAEGEHGFLEIDLVAHTVTSARGTEHFPQERDDMFLDQTTAFLAAIDGGDARQLATFDEGGKAIAICDAARVSNGNEVAVADWRNL